MDTHTLTLPSGLSTRVVDTGGAGVPVVLVHGLAASVEIWEDVLPALAASHRVLAFDLPGFGKASKPDASYRAEFFIDELAGFLDALGVERAHMVGSSMGASLIVRAAPKLGGRYASAALFDPGGFGRYVHPFLRLPTLPLIGPLLARPNHFANVFATRLSVRNPDVDRKALVELQDRLSAEPGFARAFVRTLRGFATVRGVFDLDKVADEARSLTCPTLLLWGRDDKLFPPSQMEAAKAALPNVVRSEVLERCGHFPQIDRPEATAEAVLDLVQLAGRSATVT